MKVFRLMGCLSEVSDSNSKVCNHEQELIHG